MNEAHWTLLSVTAAIAAALLLFSGAVGGVGLNLFNLVSVTLLGLPGYAAAAAILSFP